MKYRKKPVEVEAVQFLGRNMEEINKLMYENKAMELIIGDRGIAPLIKIKTLEGIMAANIGDWIVKGVAGEFYPCRNDIFEKTYEKVEDGKLSSSDEVHKT